MYRGLAIGIHNRPIRNVSVAKISFFHSPVLSNVQRISFAFLLGFSFRLFFRESIFETRQGFLRSIRIQLPYWSRFFFHSFHQTISLFIYKNRKYQFLFVEWQAIVMVNSLKLYSKICIQPCPFVNEEDSFHLNRIYR